MNKHILIVFLIIVGCNTKPQIDGFGEIKLGMTLTEYEILSNRNSKYGILKEEDEYYKIGDVRINSTIMLKNGHLKFDSNDRLKIIAFDFNKTLYDSLKKELGIRQTVNSNYFEEFNTKSDSIYLVNEHSSLVLYNIPHKMEK